MAKTQSKDKTPKESALSRAFTNGRMRFRRTAPSATYCRLTWRNRCGWK
jgi:hypothetical protein